VPPDALRLVSLANEECQVSNWSAHKGLCSTTVQAHAIIARARSIRRDEALQMLSVEGHEYRRQAKYGFAQMLASSRALAKKSTFQAHFPTVLLVR
jgi:hypothetical protein